MNEQDGTQTSPKQRRSHKTNTTHQQNGKKAPDLQCPANDDTKGWKAYWKAQDQSWRTEPEIDIERQKYLSERRVVVPNIEQGIYPFKDIKLSRADVEWLLSTHENGGGPVNWSDKVQHKRKGLDLRGANLCQENLTGLPLAGMCGGLTTTEWSDVLQEQQNMSVVQLQGANLTATQLQGAYLTGANLQKATLMMTKLQGAYLSHAQLQGAYLRETHLEGAILSEIFFDTSTQLIDIVLNDEKQGLAKLADIYWGGVNVTRVDWPKVILGEEHTAHQPKHISGVTKSKKTRLHEFKRAMRASRQLAAVLQQQGLYEEAAQFTYRAQVLHRNAVWFQLLGYQVKLWRRLQIFMAYVLLLFLDFLAGYGYRLRRCFRAYLFVIVSFSIIYYILGRIVDPSLSPLGSFVFSITSFHGRGFFPGGIKLDDPLTVLAAIEACVGLLIEVTFIAALTQRLLGK